MNNPDQKTVTGKDVARVELMPPSFTLRVGNRRLTMSWRPRKPVPTLLTGLLRRSWCAMFGNSLRISMTAAAICAAWNVPALAAAPPVNTLPTTTVNGNTVVGGTVTYGNATFTQNGNTLNINQTTGQAIANFTTFSIGSNAVVDISQPNAAAAFLARVTGSDPSLIYGLLKSNGTVALINQNGILVGPTGVVDVARFIASTLNISDSDFLAGRLTFNNGATAGNVENQGTIKSATGGSVYLIGANVTNSGVITSPNGEILLAAGQTVQLVDTATPGVSVNVTGATGSVTNLGTISAAAGRIGIAAGLINNSGNINASSVVSDGGRIFLRASQNLTTTASSNISADGVDKGGSVVLYSDKVAYLDGDISARGAAGKGGYVETSGKQSLDVVKVPTVGSGGEWYIDPYDLTVVSDSVADQGTTPGSVISSSGGSSTIRASEINTLLNADTSVTLVTGQDGGSTGGNITVNSAITKSSGVGATLTLDADSNIYINANITSTSGTLGLNLNANYEAINSGNTYSTVLNGAKIALNSGALNVSDGINGPNSGNLFLTNGSVLDLSSNRVCMTSNFSGSLATGNLTVDATSSVVNADASGYNGHFNVSGTLNNQGAITLNNMSANVATLNNDGVLNINKSGSGVVISNAITNNSTGTINLVNASAVSADTVGNSGIINITNSSISTTNGFTNNVLGRVNANYLAIFANGMLTNLGTMSFDSTANKPNGYTGSTDIALNNGVTNFGNINVIGRVNMGEGAIVNNGNSDHLTANFSVAAGATVHNGTWSNYGNMTLAADGGIDGSAFTNSGNVTLNGSGMTFPTITNNLGGNISGTGVITSNGQFANNGVISPGGDGVVGALTINGNFTQSTSGVLNIDVASASSYDVLTLNAPTTVQLGGTLQSKLLGGYMPALGTSLTPIVFANSNAGSSYFRHVLGDVINAGGALQMLKVDYKGALSLVMSGSQDFTFSGGDGGNWGSLGTWGGVGYIPTAIDNVSISSGSVLSHSDGTDIVNSITINGGELQLLSGTVKTTNLTSTGRVTIGNHDGGSGSLNVSGTAQMSSLNIDGSGYSLNGTSGSTITVNGTFSQTGGAVINSSGNVALTQATPAQQNGDVQTEGTTENNPANLVVGNITAANLALTSVSGNITQTDALHVTQQLTSSSATGTTLDNANNQIAAYTGANSGNGNIMLKNTRNLTDTASTGAVIINGINNAGGDIIVDNTGGMATTGLIKASTGAVSLSTHSPLTIGNGGVNAAGNILLSAGNSGSATDNLIINGVVNSAGGTINLFAGNNIGVNANIATSSPGQALFNVVNGTITYAPGVSVTDVSGTRIPVAAVVAQVVTPVVTQTIAPAANTVITSTTSPQSTTVTVVPPSLSSTSTTNTATETMTTGGDPGTFGGSDTSSSGKSSTSEKTGTKTASKLYCS